MARWTRARIKRLGTAVHTKLRHHLADLGFLQLENGMLRPPTDEKEIIRGMHRLYRDEVLRSEKAFLDEYARELIHNFADGAEVHPHQVSPRLELVEADTFAARLFRFASLTWSVPVSRGYGRRMRFLVWDDNNDKLIGLIALGDPVFNLRVRDQLIGWGVRQREERLANVMDAYVLGAVPPYNQLLGGKLLACLIRSREVRDIFAARYGDTKGIISKKKKHASLAIVTTSSALGRSSVYNRLKIGSTSYFDSIGYTTGWGHFHVPADLFDEMRRYTRLKHHRYANGNKFGDGPNWKLRLVRAVLDELGYKSDLLRHGIRREVFMCRFAENAEQVLRGEEKHLHYHGLETVKQVSAKARERWLVPRSERRPEYKLWKKDHLWQLFSGEGESPLTYRSDAAAAV